MPLFQQSVLKKYIADLNKEELAKAWQLFQTHFGNPAIQENIRNSKEEQYPPVAVGRRPTVLHNRV